MTVGELKRILENYPDEAVVLVEGSEEGFDDVAVPVHNSRVTDVNDKIEDWYSGRYFTVQEAEKIRNKLKFIDDMPVKTFNAIILMRKE